jgi:chemotaxis methyl-accepting protein methylase
MRALDLVEYQQYHDFLRENPAELKLLLDTLTINLSYFFRNPEAFDYLKENVLPALKKKRETLIFWSAGCARGEEAYSLAILAAETNMLHRTEIYGTDIDHNALSKAAKGIYPHMVFQYTPVHFLEKYFDRNDEGFQIKEKIKTRVKFEHHDVFKDTSFGPCDLIMCRNVMIYLGREAQSTVLKNFYKQLKPGGYLMIGKVELLIGIPEVKLFEVESRTEHVYRKIENSR